MKNKIYHLIYLVCLSTITIGQNQNYIDEIVIDVDTNLQLFIDDYVIETYSENLDFRMHNPISEEIVINHNQPWEGNSSVYHSVFKDGDIYRMYYRGSQIDIDTIDKKISGPHPVYYCYAESKDGINWTKPNLGLYEFEGSKDNNIILSDTEYDNFELKIGDNASFFIDKNPSIDPDEKYKAFVMSKDPHGLMAYTSSDAINWVPMTDTPVITNGAFDSQNIGFWDSEHGVYRAYWRYFHPFLEKDVNSLYSGIRAIRTATSRDFITWENENELLYESSPHEQLYTNQVMPYFRAPHVMIGIPNRYVERGWSFSMEKLPEYDHRKIRSSISQRYGTGLTDALLMSSRDGVTFNRWNEAFFRPGIERPGTWNYGQHYIAWGIVPTKSKLLGAPDELSFYSAEGFWTDNNNQLRRYTLRMDGFVSVHGSRTGGSLITKPIKFRGEKLYINFSSSVAGAIKVEIQDARGVTIPGFSLEDCEEIFGDNLMREVKWANNLEPGDIVEKEIRLKFLIKDADLYSFKFH